MPVDRLQPKDGHEVQLFRQLLLSKYGNFVRAWRNVLDRDGSGRVTLGEFVAGCRRIHFPGDAAHLFHELAGDDNMLELDELDPEAAKLLTSFSKFIREEFGTVYRAFAQGLDLDRGNDICEEEFVHASILMGFQCASFRKLYDCLDFDHSGAITLDEISFLTHWKSDVFLPPSATELLRKRLRSNRGAVGDLVQLVARGAAADALPGDPGERRPSGRPRSTPGRHLAETALMKATERGDDTAVERLLRWNADPNLRNGFGHSALHRLAMRSRQVVDVGRILKLLVAYRAEVNVRTPADSTPLHLAVNVGNAATALALLQSRADPCARDKQNRSPLFFAVYKDSEVCVKVLLAFLADPCRNDRNDLTALEYARTYGRRYETRVRAEVTKHGRTYTVDEHRDLIQEHTREHYARLLPAALDEICREEEEIATMPLHELRVSCREKSLDEKGPARALVQRLRQQAFEKAPEEVQQMLSCYLEHGGVDADQLRPVVDMWWAEARPNPLVGVLARACFDVLGAS